MHILFTDYQKSLNSYNNALSKVHSDAIKIFQSRACETINSTDEQTEVIKQIYDLWIAACEEVYSEYAMSDEYTKLYGDLVNALMAVKKQMTEIIDGFLENINMPTRKELNTLHKRLQETRREQRKTQKELDELKAMVKNISNTNKKEGK